MPKTHTLSSVSNDMNFIEKEEAHLKRWYDQGIVDKYVSKNAQSDNYFSFFDGPITANNPMGVHHGWGRTYKDLWQKYKNLKGHKQRFQNGFDCQGLWVEVEVEKELGFKTKKDIETYGVEKFVNKCKERVMKYAAIQTDQSKRLGYFMDWEHSYFTMSDHNNYMIWHFLKVCHKNGWIYKGNESVPWCPRCQTAISQHEMLTEDYKEVVHKAIYLALPIKGKDKEFLLIWTTTPWTIPANIAVAVDAAMDYALVLSEAGDSYWVAKEAVERVFKGNHKGIKTIVKGSELVGLAYISPFDGLPAVAQVSRENPDTFHTVIATDPLILPITAAEGTGMVHTAVSAGVEDFKLGKLRGLPMIPVIDDQANYIEGLGFLEGKNAKKHPEIIFAYLKEREEQGENWVVNIENYKHRYPACWRCKTELVWKVAEEWYIGMDKPGLASNNPATLRERMKAVAKQINWIPSFGLERELDWLTNMHDWLISKPNRYWGLALPIYECKACGYVEVIGSKEELKNKAVSGWDEFEGNSPHKPWIDAVTISCASCNKEVSRLPDVGNVWLDAGVIPFSTLVDPKTGELSYTHDKDYWSHWFPAHFITESFPGQFKNWFYSMIAMATVLEDKAPFNTVLGYASMLGEDGRPMHKSWGNSIEFNEGASKIGVDIMRWMYTRHNPLNNLLFGYKLAGEVRRQFFLILYNSYRFYVNNAVMSNWKPSNSVPKPSHVLDRWIVSRLVKTGQYVERSLDSYDAFHAAEQLELFVQDLSTWYIRRSRDRVSLNALNHDDKSQALEVMHYIFVNLSVILSPFMPFVTEEMYQNLTGEESVHLATWPDLDKQLIDEELEKEMALVRLVVTASHAKRKESGVKVRQPLSLLTIKAPSSINSDLYSVIAEEVNVKDVVWQVDASRSDLDINLNTELNQELLDEGAAREIIRKIMDERKKVGTRLDEQIEVSLPSWPHAYEEMIKAKVLATKLHKGKTLLVIRQ